MAELKSDTAKAAGCIFGIVTILVMFPLWIALLYGLLEASSAPQWCWVIFYVYLPISFAMQIARQLIETVVDLK